MPKLQSKLPEKLSACLTLAIKDMDKCYKSPKFVINMSEYFSIQANYPRPNITAKTPCHVCLAGATIAKTINGKDMSKYDEMSPSTMYLAGYITSEDSSRLYALDKLRQGDIYGALSMLNLEDPRYEFENLAVDTPEFRQGIGYGNEGEYKDFRQDLFAVRDYLKKEGY